MINTAKIDEAQRWGKDLSALTSARDILQTAHQQGGADAVLNISFPPLQSTRDAGSIAMGLQEEMMRDHGETLYTALIGAVDGLIRHHEEQIQIMLVDAVAVDEPKEETVKG